MMERAYRDSDETLLPAETTDDNEQNSEPVPDPTPAQSQTKRPRYGRSYLINKLNYINFQNGTIQAVLTHRRYDQTTICPASPQPCEGRRLICRWSEPEAAAALLENYRFSSLFVNDGRHALEVVPRVVRMDAKGIELELPDECREVANRRDVRYACDRIPVQVIQNSMLFRGVLLEFSTRAFRIALTVSPPQTFQCLDHAKPLNLIVFDGDELVFTGDFTILKSGDGRCEREFVLKPEIKAIQRYNAKVYRSKRIELKPAPQHRLPAPPHRPDSQLESSRPVRLRAFGGRGRRTFAAASRHDAERGRTPFCRQSRTAFQGPGAVPQPPKTGRRR